MNGRSTAHHIYVVFARAEGCYCALYAFRFCSMSWMIGVRISSIA